MKIHFGRGPCATPAEVAKTSYFLGCNIGYITQLYSVLWGPPENVKKLCKDAWEHEYNKYRNSTPNGEDCVGYVRHFVATVQTKYLDAPAFKEFLKVFPLQGQFEIREAHTGGKMTFLILNPPEWHKEVL